MKDKNEFMVVEQTPEEKESVSKIRTWLREYISCCKYCHPFNDGLGLITGGLSYLSSASYPTELSAIGIGLVTAVAAYSSPYLFLKACEAIGNLKNIGNNDKSNSLKGKGGR